MHELQIPASWPLIIMSKSGGILPQKLHRSSAHTSSRYLSASSSVTFASIHRDEMPW